MKRLLGLLVVAAVAFSSCSKKDSFDAAAQAVADDNSIQAYLKANPSIVATKDASGLYYQIITQGTGANATATSTVNVTYNGKLLDGSTFNATTTTSFALSGVIQGWQIGIPLVKSGGRILLIVPSALGYGNSSPAASIPNNSVLVFTIDVLSVR